MEENNQRKRTTVKRGRRKTLDFNPLNAVTIYIYIYGHFKLPVIAATIYIYAHDKFVRFPHEAKKLNELRVGPSLLSNNEAKPHLLADIIC